MIHPTDLTPSGSPAATLRPYTPLWQRDLDAAARNQATWLWHGYLAPGNVTLLTSQWKSGKTTLVSVLLSRLQAGGTLAGLPLTPGKAVVISEEGPLHWYHRSQKLPFGEHVCWFLRPFRGKPRLADWLDLLDHILELRERHPFNLLVIDPLASFLPGRNENGAGGMLDALMPLQRLTTQGVSVLVLHHPRKGETIAGQAARGSGALSGYVDIVIEMQWYGGPSDDDRRRKLRAYSRHEETPRHLVIELSADGTDYLSHGDFDADEFSQNWMRLRLVLEEAYGKLTRQEILNQWPRDFPAPGEVSLWRWLERAVADKLVLQQGTDRKNDPFRYWLPEQEEKWRYDPFHLPDIPGMPDLLSLPVQTKWAMVRYAQDVLEGRVAGRKEDDR